MRAVLGRIALLVAVLAVLMGAALWVALPAERIAAVAAERLERATGRRVRLGGALTPTLWPRPGISIGPLSLGNPDWAEAPELIAAEAARIGVDPLALLGGRIEIDRITLDAPRLALEIAPDGRRSWDLAPAGGSGNSPRGSSGTGSGGGSGLSALHLDISDGTVAFHDRRGGVRHVVRALDLDLNHRAAATAADEARLSVAGAGRYRDLSFELDLTADAEGPFAPDIPVRVEAVLDTDLGRLTLEGRASDATALAGEGSLALVIDDPAALLAALDLPPVPPRAGALAALDLAARIDHGPGGGLLETEASLRRDGVALTLAAKADAGPDWREGGAISTDLRLDAGALGAVHYSGAAALTGDLYGLLDLGTADLGRLAGWLGLAQDALPPMARGPAALTGSLSRSGDRVQLDAMRLRLDGGFAAEGLLGVETASARPAIFGTLALSPVLLPDTQPGTRDRSPTPSDGGGWSTALLPWQALDLADLDLRLSAPALDTGRLTVRDIALTLRGTGGRLDVDVERAAAFDGMLAGRVTLDARRQAVAGDLRFGGVRLEQALAALAGTDRIEGQGALSLALGAAGGSVSALVSSLDGTVAIDLADGAIRGVDLARISRELTGAVRRDARTDLTVGQARLAVVQGRMQVEELRATGPLLTLRGDGAIELPARAMDMRLVPRIVAGAGAVAGTPGIEIPVRVRGPWAALSFEPDLGAYEDALRARADDAVARARDRLESDLATGTDPGDALRGAVESLREGDGGALDALRGLFR